MTLMKLRLGFLFTDLSQQFRMYLMVFALKFFIHGDVKSFICVVKLTSHTTATQIENQISKFREPQQRTFVTLSRFWLFKGLGAWVNLLKNENLWQKSFSRKRWIRF